MRRLFANRLAAATGMLVLLICRVRAAARRRLNATCAAVPDTMALAAT